MNLDPPVRALLDRYLTGECSAAEAEQVRQWLAADAANAARLEELREIREVMRSRATWDVANLWQRTTEAISRLDPDGVFAQREAPLKHIPSADAHVGGTVPAPEPMPEPVSTPDEWRVAKLWRPPELTSSRLSSRWRLWKVAAAILVLAGAGALWQATRPLASMAGGSKVATLQEYSTGRGQLAEVKLPDGTTVLLSAASRLRVPTEFGRSRRVYLEGEARFTVPPRNGQPFEVYAGGLVTRDLSTEFGVRAYPGEAGARVVVSEGSVAVRDALPQSPATVLDAGDVLTRGADETVAVLRGVDVAPYLAWTHRELVFHGVPVREVLRELHRWYDLEFEITDSTLATRKLNATLAADGITTEVLDLLAASSDMQVRYHGRTAVFSPAHEHQPAPHGTITGAK